LELSTFVSTAAMTTESSRPAAPETKGPVIVAAGRRVDVPGTTMPRFPPENVPLVHTRIHELIEREHPVAVVASAACGADLLLLQAAQEAQSQLHVLLPASPEQFRESSVADRPGNWSEIYSDILRHADVKVLNLPDGQEGYLAINLQLLDTAQAVAADYRTDLLAVVIWNQESRGDDDVTAHFLQEAQRRHMAVREISTL